ncbi:MAG: hypothetical protein WC375_05680 [Methanomassiliicoccales archaeon]|jgi:hypothetical protein
MSEKFPRNVSDIMDELHEKFQSQVLGERKQSTKMKKEESIGIKYSFRSNGVCDRLTKTGKLVGMACAMLFKGKVGMSVSETRMERG